jgi:RNA polymerase sigma-70 factor (ECF subfamily)
MSESEMHTTAMLLHRIRAGDQDAKSALVARIDPLLKRFARGRVPRQLRAEQDTLDFVQSTWARVLDRIGEFDAREPGAFFSYLRVALVNGLREALRKQKYVGSSSEIQSERLEAEAVDPDDWVAWEQALESMEPPVRGLVLMRFEFGMSYGEIGLELGHSPDAVRMQLTRALAKMAQLGHVEQSL